MSRAPILVLWTSPRTASTAFERMMMERGDFTVVHEPFSLHYYFGPGRHSSRYEETKPHSTPDAILARLENAARDRGVFVKDMAYHVRHLLDGDLLDGDLLDRCTHTFLVRDPAWALPSLARRWPDFTDEEAGYDALADMLDAVRARGTDPVVVDSDDLRADPEGIVRSYCHAVGIPFVQDALHWDPGMREEWGDWEDWHRDAAASRGFLPPTEAPAPPLDSPRLVAAYERCAPIYAHLRAQRLRSLDPPATHRRRLAGGG